MTHRTVQPSAGRFDADGEQGFGRRERSRQRNGSSTDIELTNIGRQPVRSMARASDGGRQMGAKTVTKSSPNLARSPNRGASKKHIYRNPFGSTRRCKYQHRNCVYDHRLRKCREQLTPVAEVSTPDSSSHGLSSASTISSRKSRPGTPMAIPGSAKRIPSPDYYTENECMEDESSLPGFVSESENGVTTLKATATVTLELTSPSSSMPYRVTRLHKQSE